MPKDILLKRITLSVPLEQEGVEGEEAVKRVGVGGHTVSPCRAAHHRQHGAVIPLYDGVAEHHLVLPATKTYQLLRTSREGNLQMDSKYKPFSHRVAVLSLQRQFANSPSFVHAETSSS